MTEKNKATNSKKTEAVKVTGRTPHHSYDLKVRIEDISFGAVFKIWFFGLLIVLLVYLAAGAIFTGIFFGLR
tara:strand:+ start:235 stop:450 length:216 start_codon:yes stop_codon:yes gene_type:complete